MSIVYDQIRRLDLKLDKFQLTTPKPGQSPISAQAFGDVDVEAPTPQTSSRASHLQAVIRALSTTSGPQPLLTRRRIRELLAQAASGDESQVSTTDAGHVDDLEWLVVAKATVQAYGLIMNTLLEQTIPLSDEMWYWDDVLGSYANTSLYTLQTSPWRLWDQATDIYAEAKQKYASQTSIRQSSQLASQTLSEGWKEFYGLVQETIRDRSLVSARSRILSPFAVCRAEARRKQNGIRKLREMNATAIGLLVDEGLSFQYVDDDEVSTKGNETPNLSKDEWRSTVAKSISLMETILRNVTTLKVSVTDFEEGVFTSVEEDPEIISTTGEEDGTSMKASQLVHRLSHILRHHLPTQESTSFGLATTYGRPSRLVRYWIPATLGLVFGSTLLKVLANRKAEIITWIREFGSTIVDFWANWVIEPVKKLIGTIRHDADSEVAIMSKDSLKADRASLERMVVDFAVDHPNETGHRYNDREIAEIRAKVKEGDLTPVLRAYERDLQSPFIGTVRGDLVRALLIQIQKTKVDVEVAIGGIDALLKSQELVFGFVGLTPGILVSVAVFRWMGGIFGSRRGIKRNKKQGETIRLLRNVDRVLSLSTPTSSGMLSYKDHGLLLCEVHVLRQRAAAVLPGNVHREFLEDANDLVDITAGVERQMKVVSRIRWAYAKWLR